MSADRGSPWQASEPSAGQWSRHSWLAHSQEAFVFAIVEALALAGASAGVANTVSGSPDGLVLEGSYQESGPLPAI